MKSYLFKFEKKAIECLVLVLAILCAWWLTAYQQSSSISSLNKFIQNGSEVKDAQAFLKTAYFLICGKGDIASCSVSLSQSDQILGRIPRHPDACFFCNTFKEDAYGFSDSVQLEVKVRPPLLSFAFNLILIIAPLSMLWMVRNTYRKELEAREMSMRLAILEAEAKLSGEHSHNMRQTAHDIRSPLSALNTIKYLQAEHLPSDQLELFNNALLKVTAIADEMLAMGKAYNKSNLKTDKKALIDAVLMMSRQFEATNPMHKFSVTAEVKNKGQFWGDLLRLERIVSNIVQNSIESYEQEKRGMIAISIVENSGFFEISIEDKGSGIAPEILRKIRAGSIVSSKERGNGLGISNAISTLNSWGGQAHIESTYGKGTKVTLRLPLVS